MSRINTDSPCLYNDGKGNSLREYFYAMETAVTAKCFEFRLRNEEMPVRAGGHNKFRRGISKRIAKLASARFSAREKLVRHVISFIAKHRGCRQASTREIFADFSTKLILLFFIRQSTMYGMCAFLMF